MARPADRAYAHDADGEPVSGSLLTYKVIVSMVERVYPSNPGSVRVARFYTPVCPTCGQRAKRGSPVQARAVQAFADLHWPVCPVRTGARPAREAM